MARSAPLAKYRPLQLYLAAQRGLTLTMTFTELETVLGTALPAGAGRRHWWRGTSQHRAAWHAVGWRVRVDVHQRTVTFVRAVGDG